MTKPRIAVTMGDPAGIGPEICLDLLADSSVAERCVPIVFGDAEVLRLCAGQTGKASDFQVVDQENLASVSSPSVIDLGLMDLEQLQPGTVNPATGKATFGYVTQAIDACLAKQVDAVTTCPANKEAMRSAGIPHPGHTEIFAERTQTENFCMAFISETISCSLVTVHAGYAEVPGLLSEQRIAEVIELTRETHKKLLGKEPRIAVCGLNPHAGENGLFGNEEEERIIIPAIEKMRAKGCDLTGPLPPDTAFTESRRREIDAYVCMYHDQALIPVKALAFDEAVNVTLGLPIVRTSVDHGTALDIAWQGKADASSLKAAVNLASSLV
ncbi:MAG: 4-hydroxythreonine-4-phosphate dehydrogenase PdxA [Opitutae bacterium]|nr:4-hydroxythreonine-4-phosphate dehydrogenase PdxA [Opitutae bacterium]